MRAVSRSHAHHLGVGRVSRVSWQHREQQVGWRTLSGPDPESPVKSHMARRDRPNGYTGYRRREHGSERTIRHMNLNRGAASPAGVAGERISSACGRETHNDEGCQPKRVPPGHDSCFGARCQHLERQPSPAPALGNVTRA
jgi:hypothetical protein